MTRRLICLGVLTLALALMLVPILPILAAHADAVDDWYATVCGDNGKVFRWIAYGGMSIGGASLLTNSKTIQGLPVVGPLLNLVALNLRAVLEAMAKNAVPPSPPALKSLMMAMLLAPLALALSACAQLGLTGNPANDVPVISADILKTVNAACTEYAPIGALAAVVPDPKVQAIALTTNGVCDVATGLVIPGVASKLDASSAAWVGLSVGMLKALGVQPAPATVSPSKPA